MYTASRARKLRNPSSKRQRNTFEVFFNPFVDITELTDIVSTRGVKEYRIRGDLDAFLSPLTTSRIRTEATRTGDRFHVFGKEIDKDGKLILRNLYSNFSFRGKNEEKKKEQVEFFDEGISTRRQKEFQTLSEIVCRRFFRKEMRRLIEVQRLRCFHRTRVDDASRGANRTVRVIKPTAVSVFLTRPGKPRRSNRSCKKKFSFKGGA